MHRFRPAIHLASRERPRVSLEGTAGGAGGCMSDDFRAGRGSPHLEYWFGTAGDYLWSAHLGYNRG